MAKGGAKNIFQPTFPISLSGLKTEELDNFYTYIETDYNS
jgi:hypothetical protein